MAVVQLTLAFVKRGTSFPGVLSKNLPKYGAAACVSNVRNISSLVISKNLELITKEKKTEKSRNLKLSKLLDKPTVILLSWLLAKRRHIYKFASYYTTHGFDVLNVSVTPFQLLWPAKGTQVVASSILKFIELNTNKTPLVVHGFSVGGYLWGEVLVQIARDRERYQSIVDRIQGQVWDSAADITEISIGIPVAIFPNNVILRTTLQQYLLYHMKVFDRVSTCHYVRASQMFHTNLVKAPAQFFLSKTDPIGAERSNKRARDNWENMGIKIHWKCWDNSPHVGHFHQNPKEYIDQLNIFLNSISLLPNVEQLEIKNHKS